MSGTCGRYTKSWVQSSAPYKLNVVAHTNNPSIQEVKIGRSESQGILGYVTNWESDWIIYDMVSKTKQKNGFQLGLSGSRLLLSK